MLTLQEFQVHPSCPAGMCLAPVGMCQLPTRLDEPADRLAQRRRQSAAGSHPRKSTAMPNWPRASAPRPTRPIAVVKRRASVPNAAHKSPLPAITARQLTRHLRSETHRPGGDPGAPQPARLQRSMRRRRVDPTVRQMAMIPPTHQDRDNSEGNHQPSRLALEFTKSRIIPMQIIHRVRN